jgi:hypothetical protein
MINLLVRLLNPQNARVPDEWTGTDTSFVSLPSRVGMVRFICYDAERGGGISGGAVDSQGRERVQ